MVVVLVEYVVGIDVVVVDAVLLVDTLSLHCHRDGKRISGFSLISGSYCHCQKPTELTDVDFEVGMLVVV